jgi:2',3'-cyclic-nucleotide 2'-phosphodiesterase (5'-nucleotidase family)
MHNTQTLLLVQMICCILFLSTSAKAQKNKKYNSVVYSHQYPLQRSNGATDMGMEHFLYTIKDSLNKHLEEVIVQSALPLTKAQPESSLGNWIADAVVAQLGKKHKINACIIHYGSIGVEYWAPGVLKRRDFYQLIPHENKIVLYQLNGIAIKQLCDSIASLGGIPISGISFTIKEHRAQGILINHQAINDHLMYSIALNDFMIFHKKFSGVLNKQQAKASHKSLRNILIETAIDLHQKGATINATLDNRISYAE